MVDCPESLQGMKCNCTELTQVFLFEIQDMRVDYSQVYFDHVDNMEPAPEDVTILQQLIFTHFNISDRYITLGMFTT